MTNKNEQRKVPELRFPEFSEEWEKFKLKDLTTKTGEKNKENFNYPIASINNKIGFSVSGEGNYSNTSADIKEYRKVKKGEFGYNPARVNVGSLGYQDKEEILIVSSLYVIFKINKKLNSLFLYTFLKSNKFNRLVKQNTEGSVREYLFYENFSNISLYIPSVSEQQKIGEFFSKLDRQIELEEKKLALLEEQKKGYMQKIFSQELRFKDENAEEYPEWEEVVFSKLFKSKIEKNNDLEFDKNKIISVAKMQYKEDNNKDSSNEYMKTYNKMRLNDIAFEGNKSKDYRYGRFVLNDIGDGIVSHVFIVFSPIMDFESSFMKYYINYEPIMGRKLLFATTSTLMMTSLKTNEFMNLSIRLPGINEQRKIGLFISTFNKKIETQNMKVSLLINMKKQLLNKMMI